MLNIAKGFILRLWGYQQSFIVFQSAAASPIFASFNGRSDPRLWSVDTPVVKGGLAVDRGVTGPREKRRLVLQWPHPSRQSRRGGRIPDNFPNVLSQSDYVVRHR